MIVFDLSFEDLIGELSNDCWARLMHSKSFNSLLLENQVHLVFVAVEPQGFILRPYFEIIQELNLDFVVGVEIFLCYIHLTQSRGIRSWLEGHSIDFEENLFFLTSIQIVVEIVRVTVGHWEVIIEQLVIIVSIHQLFVATGIFDFTNSWFIHSKFEMKKMSFGCFGLSSGFDSSVPHLLESTRQFFGSILWWYSPFLRFEIRNYCFLVVSTVGIGSIKIKRFDSRFLWLL